MTNADIQTLIEKMSDVKGRLEYLIEESNRINALDNEVSKKAEIVRQRESALLTQQAEINKTRSENMDLKIQLSEEAKRIEEEKDKLVLMVANIKKERTASQVEISQRIRDIEVRESKTQGLEQERKSLQNQKVEIDRQNILIEKERQLFTQRMEKVDALEKRLTEKMNRFNNLLKE
jgi:chromosome segregation ATPase